MDNSQKRGGKEEVLVLICLPMLLMQHGALSGPLDFLTTLLRGMLQKKPS